MQVEVDKSHIVKFNSKKYCSLMNDGSYFSYLVNTMTGSNLQEILDLKKSQMVMNDAGKLRVECVYNERCSECKIYKNYVTRKNMFNTDEKTA